MGFSTIWLEITISGFIYVLSAFFIVLRLLHVTDLSFISYVEDHLTLLSLATVAISYFVGMFAHRTISFFIFPIIRFVIRRLYPSSRPKQEKPSIRLFIRKGIKSIAGSSPVLVDPIYKHGVYIWQYGSIRLHKELDFQFSILALFRSLIFAFPLLGVTSAIWFSITIFNNLAIPLLVTFVILGFICIFIYRWQNTHFLKMRNAANEEMEIVRTHQLNN